MNNEKKYFFALYKDIYYNGEVVNEELITTFDSIKEASIYLNCSEMSCKHYKHFTFKNNMKLIKIELISDEEELEEEY